MRALNPTPRIVRGRRVLASLASADIEAGALNPEQGMDRKTARATVDALAWLYQFCDRQEEPKPAGAELVKLMQLFTELCDYRGAPCAPSPELVANARKLLERIGALP